MDNRQQERIPDVPLDDQGWPLYSHLHTCVIEFGRNDEARVGYRLQRRMLLKQLSLMGNTRCQACGGRSHRHEHCPTNARLGMLSAGNDEWKKLIAWARRNVNKADRLRIAGLLDEPVHHVVPMNCSRKRTWAQKISR